VASLGSAGEYRDALRRSATLKRDDIVLINTLDCFLDKFRIWLMSFSGKDRTELSAHAAIRNVRHVVEDLLEGEPFSPTVLKKLQSIGKFVVQVSEWRQQPR